MFQIINNVFLFAFPLAYVSIALYLLYEITNLAIGFAKSIFEVAKNFVNAGD